MFDNKQPLFNYHFISTPSDAVAAPMEEIMGVYNLCFPHGARSRREFEQIIALNGSHGLRQEWRDNRYDICYVQAEKIVVGIGAYMILPAAARGAWDGYDAVVFIDYRAVHPAVQKSGIAKEIEQHAICQATCFLAQTRRVRADESAQILVMNESSIPVKMSLRDYEADQKQANIDPCDRIIRVWGKQGYRRLLPNRSVKHYVEPAFQNNIGCLDYSLNAKIPDGYVLSASTLAQILEAWAGIRHFFGGDPQQDSNFRTMIDQIHSAQIIPPVDDREYLRVLKPSIDILQNHAKNWLENDPRRDMSIDELLRRENMPCPAHP
jgi:hypothetical protein